MKVHGLVFMRRIIDRFFLLQLSDSSVAMEKHGRSESPNDEVRQSELNRMASIRLHQKLVQSHDKQWHAGPEVIKVHKIVPGNEHWGIGRGISPVPPVSFMWRSH